MAAPWRNISYPRALAVTLATVLAVTLLYGGLTSTTAFGAYNSAWDGAADLRTLADDGNGETALLQNTSTYADYDPNGSVSIVLSPDETYSSRDARRIETFVREGGTLVVAEDFGAESNALLAAIGAQARFDGRLLRDERTHDTAPTLPIASNLSAHSYTAGVDQLTLNRGTPVEANSTTVLATTTNYSYADTNVNGKLDDAETMRQYPVATIEDLGAGEVVALGDPSLFINAMLERPGNRQFARNILAAHDTRLVDVSHLDALPPLVRAQFTLRDSPLLQIAGGLALVVLVVYLGELASVARTLRRRLLPGSAGPLDADRLEGIAPGGAPADRSTVERWVRERHPDWSAERVQRVTDRVMWETPKDRTND